jgi:hypothetical protein
VAPGTAASDADESKASGRSPEQQMSGGNLYSSDISPPSGKDHKLRLTAVQ